MDSPQSQQPPAGIGDLPPRQRRIIRAWCIYDWANSAFATSAVAAIVPVYLVLLFKESLGDEAVFLGITFTGSSVWSLAVVVSTLTVALTSPVLGVISDRVPIKKTLLWIYTATGALFTVLSFFSAYTGEPWAWVIGSFTLASVGFTGSLVFYNAFLPHLGPRHLWDEISSRGFAYGYVGGGLLLLVHLGVILAFQDTRYEDLATRVAIASVGFWWFGFAIWTLKAVPEPPIENRVHGLTVRSSMALAARELGKTFRQIRRFKEALKYLGAYMLFNDGVQTVLAIAGAFAADTLGIPLAFNMATIVIIQFVAAPGAMLFSRLAAKITTKAALTVSLAGWSVIVLFGVAMAALPPEGHDDYDIRLAHTSGSGGYTVAATPDLSDSEARLQWMSTPWRLAEGDSLTAARARDLLEAAGASENFQYGVSIQGGPLDGRTALGPAHPSNLGDGPFDWWPSAVRGFLWAPLGLAVGHQWLLLGVMVGLVIGGSQALARSLFAHISPEGRSGEFFSFFGFVGRASAVVGPAVYVAATAVWDTRVAVVAIMLIIVAGAVALQWVDVDKGVRDATKDMADRG